MIFVFHLLDAPGKAELRLRVRPEHKAYLAAVADRDEGCGGVVAIGAVGNAAHGRGGRGLGRLPDAAGRAGCHRRGVGARAAFAAHRLSVAPEGSPGAFAEAAKLDAEAAASGWPRGLREVTGLPVLGTVSMLTTPERRSARRRGLLAFGAGLFAYVGMVAAAVVALQLIQG